MFAGTYVSQVNAAEILPVHFRFYPKLKQTLRNAPEPSTDVSVVHIVLSSTIICDILQTYSLWLY